MAYNADIPDIVMSKIDEGKDVTYVDINSVIEPSDLHTDYNTPQRHWVLQGR